MLSCKQYGDYWPYRYAWYAVVRVWYAVQKWMNAAENKGWYAWYAEKPVFQLEPSGETLHPKSTRTTRTTRTTLAFMRHVAWYAVQCARVPRVPLLFNNNKKKKKEEGKPCQ